MNENLPNAVTQDSVGMGCTTAWQINILEDGFIAVANGMERKNVHLYFIRRSVK